MGSMGESFARIEAWMKENGAESIVDNLAPGATEDALAEVEVRLGFALPSGLRELWAVHDGQLAELDGFYESYDLRPSSATDDDSFAFLVEASVVSPRTVAASGLAPQEIASTAWLMIAARDSDGVAVNADTGRVFRVAHDDSPSLYLLAPSVDAWFVAYADAVTNDDYRVEEGFGHVYLARRDRQAEAREEASNLAQAVETARRAALSPLALMEEAVEGKSESKAQQALERMTTKDRDAVMIALFLGDPSFVASVLRAELRRLTLSPAQWKIVAIGGERLGNNAIVAHARRMASG